MFEFEYIRKTNIRIRVFDFEVHCPIRMKIIRIGQLKTTTVCAAFGFHPQNVFGWHFMEEYFSCCQHFAAFARPGLPLYAHHTTDTTP